MLDAFYKNKTISNRYCKGLCNKDYMYNNFNKLSEWIL